MVNPDAEKSIDICGKVYALHALDNSIRKVCSSGGAFYLLAKRWIDNGGIVYGAAFKDGMIAHQRAADINELLPLLGSKYAQSNLTEALNQIKKDVALNNQILFSGLPCQIAAIKKLYSNYDKILFVDILCYGAPDFAYFKSYIKEKEIEYGGKCIDIHFREKSKGWKRYSMKVEFDNGKVYLAPKDKDCYLNAFNRRWILKPSCYNCKFTGIQRMGDITLGDFWGFKESFAPGKIKDDNKGISFVMVNTPRGEMLFEEIKTFVKVESRSINELHNQFSLFPPEMKRSPESVAFESYFKGEDEAGVGFSYAFEKCSIEFPQKIVNESIKKKVIKKLYSFYLVRYLRSKISHAK